MYKKLKNCLGVRLFTLIFKVMLELERTVSSIQEYKGNIIKRNKQYCLSFFKRHHRTCSSDLGATSD